MSINAVVLKIASRCNLNCSYCYMYHHADQSYKQQPKIMCETVYRSAMQTMLKHSISQGIEHQIALIMHGGEPTLVGIKRFRWFAQTAKKILGNRLMLLSIQTNGLLLTPEWVELFIEFNIIVSISLDGTPEVNDAFRIDHQGKGSHHKTVEGIRILQQGGITPRIICVVNPTASGLTTYQHFRQLGISKLDFLFPDTTHDSKPQFYDHYGKTPIADFLIEAFDAWMAEDNANVKIRIFYNLLRSFMGAPPGSDAFGNPMVNYLIVNTDGAIEGMDALRVCDEGLVETGLNVQTDDFDDLAKSNSLLHQTASQVINLADKCQSCAQVEICGGGHFPHRYSQKNGFNNPSAWCHDIQKLFQHMRARIDNHIPEQTPVEA
ncbi:hypothetical protein MNBD_GAMMA22-891 [hydrothermal vent metagenome]|uniref:Radical SAM core domain-containing protein n=1 Tax=hydrothermal vent metagenome TaxID=652676 RepID=A0A3B1AN43_9ZZZZ